MQQDSEFKAEIDYREVFRSPRRLFAYGYVLFVVLVLALGIHYVNNLTALSKNGIAPALLPDSSAFVQDIPLQVPHDLPPVDVAKASVASPDAMARGKQLFQANCASCHGDDGTGTGPAGTVLSPKPRNFHSLAGWTNGSSIVQIYKTLQEGVPKTGMSSFSYLPPADRFALIHFVRSFATGQPENTAQELVVLDSTYHLARGSVVAGQVPIKRAMQIVAAENTPRMKAIEGLAKMSRDSSRLTPPEVFKTVAADPERAIAGLVGRHATYASLDEFIRVASSEPLQLGLRASVNTLSKPEWDQLYRYIEALRANAQ